uniref:polysaccharide deacetylase family protein n=1 Tax=uncultured Micrococcus sp. TaxID=114051 RepID=UPI00261211B5|nr:polysaccharide deacetylase family protein [uncultured Micrococcus sp.]
MLSSRPARRLRPLAAALVAAMALTGCSSGSPDGPAASSAPSSGASSAPASSAPASSPSAAEAGATATEGSPEWPRTPTLDRMPFAGLDVSTISDYHRATHLVVPQLAGAEPLNSRLRDQAQRRAEQFWSDSEGSEVSVAPPSLSGSWQAVGVSRDIVGVLTSVTEFAGAGHSIEERTTWFDAAAGTVVEPLDLVSSDSRGLLEQRVRAAVDALPGAEREMSPSSADTAWEQLRDGDVRTWFTPEGDLAIGFSEHTVLAGSAGTPAITLPASDVEPWLSDAGRAVRTAVTRPDVEAWNAAHAPVTAGPTSSAPALTPPVTPAPASSSEAAPRATPTAPSTPSATKKSSSTPSVTKKPSSAPSATKKPSSTPAAGRGRTDCSVKRCIALTFDDGPKPATDARLLEILARHDVRASFFMIGSSVDAFPGTAKKISAAGHEVGNHTYTHALLKPLGRAALDAELSKASTAIEHATGVRPAVMRPPYGAYNATVTTAIEAHGMRKAMWTVDTLDWKHRDPAKTLAIVKKEAAPGGIILMHDIHATTIEAVDPVVTWLQSQGYTLVTVSDLQDG